MIRQIPDGSGGLRFVDDSELPPNMLALLDRAAQAVAANAAFLALTNPTNAQAVTQVALLTRQVNTLVRLATGELDSTGGTVPSLGRPLTLTRRTVVADRARPMLPWLPGIAALLIEMGRVVL